MATHDLPSFEHEPECPWANTHKLLAALRDTRAVPATGSYGGFRLTTAPHTLMPGITKRIAVAVPGLSQTRSAARARGVVAAGHAHSTKGTGSALDTEIARCVAAQRMPSPKQAWPHRVLHHYVMHGIYVVANEVVVTDPSLKVATSVDDIGVVHLDWPAPRIRHAHVPGDGPPPCCKVLFIERKSGYDYISIRGEGRRAGIAVPPPGLPARLPNTIEFAHWLQAAIAKELYERKVAQMPGVPFPAVEVALVYASLRRPSQRIEAATAGAYMTQARLQGKHKTSAQGAQGDGTVLIMKQSVTPVWDTMTPVQRTAVINRILETKPPARRKRTASIKAKRVAKAKSKPTKAKKKPPAANPKAAKYTKAAAHW
jgi:hypothetical protein